MIAPVWEGGFDDGDEEGTCEQEEEEKKAPPLVQIPVFHDSKRRPLTEEQKAMVNCQVELTPGTVIRGEAFASSGKSATVEAFIRARPHLRFLYLVFNKGIKAEALKKMSNLTNVDIHTYHSLAYQYILRKGEYTLFTPGCEVKGVKYASYKQLVHAWGGDLERGTGAWLSKFPTKNRLEQPHKWYDARIRLSMIQSALAVLETFCVSGDTEIQVGVHTKMLEAKHIQDARRKKLRHELPTVKDAVAIARVLLDEILNKRLTVINYNMSVKLLQLTKVPLAITYDAAVLDEAQDAIPVLVTILKDQPWAVVVVGDSQQQINRWMGAVNAMDLLYRAADENKRHIFPLTEGFRFGKSVAELCNTMFARFNYPLPHPIRSRAKHETTISSLPSDSLPSMVEEMLLRLPTLDFSRSPSKRIAVLTHTKMTALLFIDAWMQQLTDLRLLTSAFTLQCSSGLRASLTSLCALAERPEEELKRHLEYNREEMEDDEENEELRAKVQMVRHVLGKKTGKERLQYAQGLTEMLKNGGAKGAETNEQTIILEISTIHASKGLEYDHVFVPDLSLRGMTVLHEWEAAGKAHKSDIQTGIYITYVSLTRCRLSLHLPARLLNHLKGIRDVNEDMDDDDEDMGLV